ncbi:MAG: RNA polymerase sigma factor [Acidimicrobiia bacterium]
MSSEAPPPEPGDIVARVVSGDRRAFRDIVGRYDDRLRAVAARMLAGDPHRIDDVMQEAYVRAYRAMPGFRGDADLGTWLYRITTTACLDELRRAKRRPDPVDLASLGREHPAPQPGPEQAVTTADLVARALSALPGDQRAAVVLVDGEGLTHDDAARVLEVPTGTLASRLARGRAALRALLSEEQ